MSRAWFKFYGRDYRDGVRDLPWEVTGIYSVLLTLMYEEEGGRIRDHDHRLARLVGCDIRLWKRARATLIEAGKLHVTEDGFLTNSRVETETKAQAAISEVRRKSGTSSAQVRHKSETSSEQLAVSNAPKSKKTKDPPPANAQILPLYARALPESESDIPSTSLRSVEGEPAPKKRAPKPSSKTLIPMDLPMSEQARAFAAARGFLNGSVETMWTHFTAYHAAKRTETASVEASWRTWVMNQQKFQGERNDNRPGSARDLGQRPGSGSRPQPRSAATIIMERALEDELATDGGPPMLELSGD